MKSQGIIMYEPEFHEITRVMDKLLKDSRAKVIFLVDKDGQLIAACGETETLDTISLNSITSGNIHATGGMAKLLSEKEFSILSNEPDRDNLHISIIADRVIMVIIFDQRTDIEIITKHAREASIILAEIFKRIRKKSEEENGGGGSRGGPAGAGGGGLEPLPAWITGLDYRKSGNKA